MLKVHILWGDVDHYNNQYLKLKKQKLNCFIRDHPGFQVPFDCWLLQFVPFIMISVDLIAFKCFCLEIGLSGV